jgi:hypothetical protein
LQTKEDKGVCFCLLFRYILPQKAIREMDNKKNNRYTEQSRRDLKKLSRADLLELLLAQTRELESLQQQLDELQARYDEREIVIKESGSIADAALKISGIFEAAQQAADDYVRNVVRRYGKDTAKNKNRTKPEAVERRRASHPPKQRDTMSSRRTSSHRTDDEDNGFEIEFVDLNDL